MEKQENLGITIKKEDDFSEWYNEVVIKAGLAEHSPIRGFMIIKPAGYAIWEKIQAFFDERIKKMGVQNAYFPMLIPESFFKKEAEHAKGFAPELAWVDQQEDGERYAMRPTSETIIYDSYSRWIRSWRDLPMRLNQWCNVLRWEVKQTKLFLRTREFLWQEGHCVYETEEECEKETREYLREYQRITEELLAIPVIAGEKTTKERFAGAKRTYTIEAMMPDGKALQMGTSHNLGQNFAKAFNISYLGKDEKPHIPWQNSWGITTRMVGAMVMMHSDNKGLVIPPRVAATQVVIVPIFKKEDMEKVIHEAQKIKKSLKSFTVHIDDREGYSAGWKYSEWELKGIPLRIEIGPREIEQNQVVLVRRDTGKKEFVTIMELKEKISETLNLMQSEMFEKAKLLLNESIIEAANWEEFKQAINDRKLVKVFFCNIPQVEDDIKEKSNGATSRCMPFGDKKTGKCFYTGKEGHVTYFAKAY